MRLHNISPAIAIVVCAAVVCIPIIVVFLPKPNLRIERLYAQSTVASISEGLVLSSSILGHTSRCEDVQSLRSRLPTSLSAIADGGMTLEEAYLLAQASEYGPENVVTVFGLYSYNQPLSYQIGNHRWYAKKFEGRMLGSSNWSMRDPLVLDNQILSAVDFNQYIRALTFNECTWHPKFEEIKNAIFSSIYLFEEELNLEFVEYNANLMRTISEKNIVILPPTEILSPHQVVMVEEITEILISSELDVLQLELSDFDEPWCLCGHLTGSGIQKVLDEINAH